jgi:antitoxin (DNA-binding transcriptional repressor) of toxin-antitoxin stability system
MPTFNLKSAAAQLNKLIERAQAGEEIIIMRGTKPVAKIVAIRPRSKGKRRFGALKGLGKVGSEFFKPLPEEELKLWEGGS